MIVLLEEIRDQGLVVDPPLSEEFLGEVLTADGAPTGFRPLGPASLHARFDRVADKLLLKGSTQLRVAGECRSCLTDISLDVPVQFELNLVPRAKSAKVEDEVVADSHHDTGEGSFGLETADEEGFEGRQIDLDAIAREQILLALPMDGLCKDDCKGLCSICGQDLNLEECGCERKVADPRWAALKNIKLT